ncbi:NAD(P)-binding domain-containing protein [Alcaligenaceae bacterium]|nr:NAD(P)-binding domain-containing protein [Alcaligenaceae bacterium]
MLKAWVHGMIKKTDVVIVGAGPAGIGVALALEKLPGIKYVILESHQVGESFRRWPTQTRLITPSFHSNPFGLADLNAVSESSSPAIFAGAEHLSGQQYANYLAFIAHQHGLPVVSACRVHQVTPINHEGFVLDSERGSLQARFLVWATGEYQFPELSPFPGAQWCTHYAQVQNWQRFEAPDYTVIGGYESGVDAAVNLIKLGRSVRLLTRKCTWDPLGPYDPSLSLSPYSRERMYAAVDTGRLDILFGADIVQVETRKAGGYRIHAADGRYWDDAQVPILGTGFRKGGGAQQIAELWQWTVSGHIALTENDESTLVPGLFLAGPQVRHDDRIYCFIYKFRQRFSVIAQNIGQRLGLDTGALQTGSGAWGPFGNEDCCEGCQC